MGPERAGLKVVAGAAAAGLAFWAGAMVLMGSPGHYVTADYPVDGTTTSTTSATPTTTTVATTTTSVVTTTTSNPPRSGSGGNSPGGGSDLVFTSGPPANTGSGLAFTGANVELTMAVGAGAVGVGGMLVLASKRRRPPAQP